MEKVQVEILGLSTSPSSGGAYALILNELEGARRLPIIIGTYEAQAIALELEHIKPPRPMTHDLIKNLIKSFEATLTEVYINALKEGTFFAQIELNVKGETVSIDARPSDAIAVAIRFNAPVYVASTVLEEAGLDSEAGSESTGEKPRKVIKATESEKEARKKNSEATRLDLLEKNLNAAISAEDYELAAKLRDEIQKLRG
ncbi:MAG: bifunctional nuclease family protein [Bacteroidetes bacterium]|nr:bifunctional nuclease family protein [Bacteroidota bacterium]MCH8523524.1 bifunctional nuclease family protein [Balneolales bacterium]